MAWKRSGVQFPLAPQIILVVLNFSERIVCIAKRIRPSCVVRGMKDLI